MGEREEEGKGSRSVADGEEKGRGSGREGMGEGETMLCRVDMSMYNAVRLQKGMNTRADKRHGICPFCTRVTDMKWVKTKQIHNSTIF